MWFPRFFGVITYVCMYACNCKLGRQSHHAVYTLAQVAASFCPWASIQRSYLLLEIVNEVTHVSCIYYTLIDKQARLMLAVLLCALLES